MEDKIKVIIADDEPKVCVVEENIIQWQRLNLELVGIAHDGIELLRLIEEEKPDIVVTDICMPGLSGLEIIKQVREEKINVKFIIVSGYRQFEYAHDALKYKVDDYLLKPIDAQELNDALLKLRNDILNERVLVDGGIPSVDITSDKEYIRRIFLNQVLQAPIHTRYNTAEIEENYGIVFSEALFQAVYVKLDILEETLEDSEGLDSLSSKLVRIFCKIFTPYCQELLTISTHGSIILVINYSEQYLKKVTDGYEDFFLHAKNIVDLFDTVKLTLGIGNTCSSVNEIKRSISEANEAIYYRIVAGTNRIITFASVLKPASSMDEKAIKLLTERLIRDFEALDSDDYIECIQELFALSDASSNIPELMHLCNDVAMTFFDLQNKLQNKILNEEYLKNRIYQGIMNATDLSTLQQHMTNELVKIIEQITEDKRSQSKKPIKEAIKYIETNYNKPISLGDVAQAVWLNPVYFSSVFKKETGENFRDYLHKYRINIAKDLLRTTHQNVNQICHAIGYDDANYFIKIFRKYVGLTPSEFRKIYG